MNKNNIDYEFKANDSSIYGVYCHCVLDYFIVLTSNSQLYFWSIGTGRFEKKVPYSKCS